MPQIKLKTQSMIILIRLINEKIRNLEQKLIDPSNLKNYYVIKNNIIMYRHIRNQIRDSYLSKNKIIMKDLFSNTEEIDITKP